MAAAADVKLGNLRAAAAVDLIRQVLRSGPRPHLAEQISSSRLPCSFVVNVLPSLIPQTMSISTPELLVPFGDDDLLTTTTHVPFLGLGATAAAAVPYYSGTGGGGFAREHGVDAGEQFGAAPSSMKKAEQEQIKIDIPSGAANAAADADAPGGNLASAVIGIAAASSAVTMVAAGAVSPPLAFGLFVLLLGGLSLAISGVRGA
ncbi:hypothetical protein OsI_28054 [Oryza sativa Indica Group]|uniref:Uncharacterized protein n=1 Tax=Oryza sativa subsp. indica TaxID=39946 RepID=B8BBD6_ORYSI|nr:hypothetical protein OsI_28054 [Oryza sativa Indica Group]